MSTLRTIGILTGLVAFLGLWALVAYLHKDLVTPMHCRCGRRPSLEL